MSSTYPKPENGRNGKNKNGNSDNREERHFSIALFTGTMSTARH